MSGGMLKLVVSFAAVDKLSGALRGIVGLAQSGGERLAGMKREARDLDKELRGVNKELAKAGGNDAALLARKQELEQSLARTNAAMEKQVRLLKIQAGVEKSRAHAEAMRARGAENVAGGAMALGGLALVAKGGADFQSGMTDIALKANLSVKETAKLEANIIAATRAAKQLPENLRAGVDVLSGFGMTPQQATQMIAPIGKVATAYRAQIDDLAAAAFANFSNLKVPIRENARALEVMASAGNAGAFEIKDMAQFFPSLTAQAQAFGQSGVAAVADLAAAAQIARKGTGDSAKAAGNLENLLAKINTEETIKKFEKFGVDLPAALKKAYSQGKTPLEAIAEISNKAVGGDLSRLSFLFGDMQAQSALRPLIQNMEEYRRIRSEALASKGAVDAAFARRGQDAATMARALMGNLQRLALVAGPVLLPPLIALSENLLGVTDRMAAWMQANPQATSAIIGLVAGIGAFRIGLGALQLAFGGVLGPLASVFGFLLRNGPMIASIFGGIRTAALFLGRGILQAGAMMLANPLVAAIVGIVAALGLAGYLIYKHWDTIKAAFSAGVAAVKGAISGLPAWMRQIGSNIMAGLLAFITPGALVSRLLAVARAGVTAFKNFFGIRSPSRLFMEMGGHMTRGLALGIAGGSGEAVAASQLMSRAVAGAGAGGFATGPALRPARAGAMASGGAAGVASAASPVSITINAAPGQSPDAIAQAVRRVLREEEAKRERAARSAYRDD